MITRFVTNIDTGARYEISCPVVPCEGGFTWQIAAIIPEHVYPTPEAAADGCAVDAQARYDRQVARERGKAPAARCHYCGMDLDRNGECRECR